MLTHSVSSPRGSLWGELRRLCGMVSKEEINIGKAFVRNVKRIRIQFMIDCNTNMNRDEEIVAILRKARQRRRNERKRWRPFPS